MLPTRETREGFLRVLSRTAKLELLLVSLMSGASQLWFVWRCVRLARGIARSTRSLDEPLPLSQALTSADAGPFATQAWEVARLRRYAPSHPSTVALQAQGMPAKKQFTLGYDASEELHGVRPVTLLTCSYHGQPRKDLRSSQAPGRLELGNAKPRRVPQMPVMISSLPFFEGSTCARV